MPRNPSPRFCKTLLALAASAALAPHGAWALDLTQSPPGTVEPYVAPNVIISIDDSGSMDYRLNTNSESGASDKTTPDANGNWPGNSRRINVLKYALTQVFNDTALLPEKKIRLAWQSMWNNGNAPGVGTKIEKQCLLGICKDVVVSAGATTVDSATKGVNSMSPLQGGATTVGHRKNFLDFVSSLKADNGTPSHRMFNQADAYMRRGLSSSGPWSGNPGGTDAASTKYLGCRRNYHIMMSDGGWQTNPEGNEKPGNTDGSSFILPDGTPYNKVRPYADDHANMLADLAFKSWSTELQNPSNLEGKMQPTADYRKAPQQEIFGKDKTGQDAKLDRYWNPRYDPANWPHMVTYTIGFSSAATTWSGEPNIKRPPNDEDIVPFSYDSGKNGSLPDFITGNIKWPLLTSGSVNTKNALDLWHAALNGRGRYYAVENGEDLEKAFREIIGQINILTDPDLASTATSGSNTSRNDVGRYTGAYEPTNAWKGFVTAETVKKDGTTVPAAGWGAKNSADKLDALTGVTSRLILSWSDKWDTTKDTGGVPFKWATNEINLSIAQKALLGLELNVTGVTLGSSGQNRVNFIRGDRSLEGSEINGYTLSKPFRERKSRQGDIINSVVWYTGGPASNYPLKGYAAFTRDNAARAAMVYVGGNDGMLHGFSAADGSEKIAYVPKGVIPALPLLTDPAYNNRHKYFVDGSPMTGDVDTSVQDPDASDYTPNWRTLLVGTLGAGGKGYFVMDVTNPSVSGTTSFVEGNAQQLVKLDRSRGIGEAAPNCALTGILGGLGGLGGLGMSTAEATACSKAVEEDKDIGHITARPVLDEANPMRTTQITRMNNNRWAAVMGNGYNSTNQRPVLLVQYLDGAQELLRIPVTTDVAGSGKANDNGLSAPRIVDLNGDGRADVAYAGDNLGNMWKFDLTNLNAASWSVAFGGKPLFTAKGPTALNSPTRPNIQPITIAPNVRANDRTMTIGTGNNATTVSVGGMMVAFGTGRNVTNDDPASVQVQTFYSVLDNTRYRVVNTTKGKRLEVHPGAGTCSSTAAANCVPTPKPLGEGAVEAKLAEQKITELSGGDFATVDVKNVENELKTITWAKFNGWYLDLPAIGERLLKPIEFYDGSNILVIYSQVPAKGSNVDPNVESCESTSVDEERQYRTQVNIMDGKRPTVQLVDINGDGVYNISDANVSRARVSKGSHNLFTQNDKIIDIDAKNKKEALALMPEQSLRPSWRQLR